MTDTDPRRVDDLLAQYPGPVRLTPIRRKSLIHVAAVIPALLLCIGFLLLPNVGKWAAMAGWVMLAFLVFLFALTLFQLKPGVAHLTLDAHGFEISAALRRVVFPWKAAGKFRVLDLEFVHMILFDRLKDDPPTALSRFLSMQLFPNNYSLPHADLVRLMNEWRAKAMSASTP